MERKTIGAFIAALRKANGMTQQELADMLNISNKAVSRWERDECAPDITLIPALAEILGVTCDELLKGERITSDFQQERSEPKIERQIKLLINRTISKFMLLIWISLALSAAGLICMFGISYGAFRPDIGLAVMCVFAVAAFILAAIATTKMKNAKSENELFEDAEESSINRYNKVLGNFSYLAFTFAIAAVIISVPLIPFWTNITNAVTTFGTYLMFFVVLAPAYGFLCLAFKNIYYSWITEIPRKKIKLEWNKKLIAMNSVQLGAVAILCVLFIVLSDLIDGIEGLSITGFGVIVFFVVSAVIFLAFIAICKNDRKILVSSGIRNFLTVIPALIFVNSHSVDMYDGEEWSVNTLMFALGITLIIFLIFQLIKPFINKR